MMLQGEEKKGKVKKGWLAVRVGGDDRGAQQQQQQQLRHPHRAARDAYGYDYSAGPLRLPCSVDEFLRLRALVERETQAAPPPGSSSSSSSHRVHAGGHGHYSLSPCTRAKVSS
ncbi:hypothetical protein U9M48_021786 [Paspalum notatum var. saurae]|uniref:Uncharacterized protein n=1 Tax=Paspalum notatum var. saurae TaxID=547442 RepID=A0AAQ3TI87_PASNO